MQIIYLHKHYYFSIQPYKMQDKKRIDVPDGLYTKCDSCGESILSEDLKESYYVCPKCGAHLKVLRLIKSAMLVGE